MAVKGNVNGTAKNVVGGLANVSGAAKNIKEIWANVSGVAKKVWENWAYYEGNLVVMTSNSTPAPFSSNYWEAFDNSDWNGKDYGTLYFGQDIKIKEIKEHLRTAGGSNYTPWVKLRRSSDDTWSDKIYIGTQQDNQWKYYTFSTAWQETEVNAIQFDIRETNTGVSRYVTRFQITKYWKKGS